MVAIPQNHPMLKEREMSCATNSIASTPLACAIVFPFRAKVVLTRGVSAGIFTTDCSVAIAIIPAVAGGAAPGSGTAVTGSPMVLTAANSATGTSASMTPSGANIGNEGDILTFTPSGSTGTTIGGTFSAVFQPA
jgi:hypothetical protein